MIKLSAIAAAAVALSAFAVAPAFATDLHVSSNTVTAVHVPLAGKSPAQISADIKAAAETVCKGAGGVGACVQVAIGDANRQLNAIRRAHDTSTKVEVARNDPSTVRVSLKGKSNEQVLAEIDAAAQSVCKATHSTAGIAFKACVDSSARDAKERLADITRRQQVASN